MRFLTRLIVLAALAGAALFAGTHAVILTDSDLVLAEKPSFPFNNVYVDVRDWGPSEFMQNRDVARMLAKSGVTSAFDRVRRSLGQ